MPTPYDILNSSFDGESIRVRDSVDKDPIYGATTVDTSGVAVELADTIVKNVVYVKAVGSNTGKIYVGDLDVNAANGFPLSPGEEIELAARNLSKVYIDADSGGDSVKYIGV